MADRWAVANGDWSNTATWNGGTLPAATDDVYADGYTVTIDQTITVVSINTTQRSGGTAGGGFTFTDGYTINANINAGTTTCVTINTGGTFVVNGNITGGNTNDTYGLYTNTYSISPVPPINLTITGNINGGTADKTFGLHIYGHSHTINITGDINGGSGTNSPGVSARPNYSNSNHRLNDIDVTINGNILGGSSTNAFGIQLYTNSASFTLNGNSTGGSGTYSYGFNLYDFSIVTNITGNLTGGSGYNSINYIVGGSPNIIGNITGGSAQYAYGLLLSGSSGGVTVTGDVTGGSGSSATGIYSDGSGNHVINGNVTGGSVAGAYGIYSLGFLTVNGNVTGGTANSAYGINPRAEILINGNVTGGNISGGYGIWGYLNPITVNGNVTSSGFTYSIYMNYTISGTFKVKKVIGDSSNRNLVIFTNENVLEVEEIEFGDTGSSPIQGYVKFKDVTTNQIKVLKTGDLTKTTMIDPAASGDYPVTGDVRSGTVYNYNAFTGTLSVPLATQVAAGVAVDNTVGTAILTEAGLTSILQSVLSFSSSSSVERSPDDTKAISFTWPTAGATLVGTVSIDGGSFTGVAGTVSFLYTDGAGKNWYTLSYNSADRPSSEGVARYVFSDGTYTRSYSLRVEGKVDVSALALESSMQTAISGVNDIPPLITNVVNVSTMEAF